MIALTPQILSTNNLSKAWGEMFVNAMSAPSGRLPASIISLTFENGYPLESTSLRDVLDQKLVSTGNNASSVSSMLIFPYDLWVAKGKPPCVPFSEFCVKRFYPRLRKLDSRNAYGTYFQRIMEFTGTRKGKIEKTNQLDSLITLLKRKRKSRESALQLSCFDPSKDLTGQSVRGFPCLQQISFQYRSDGTLGITGFYPTQYIFERAYGNYQGLCNLGAYVAHESKIPLGNMTCITLAPKLGDVPKGNLKDLLGLVKIELAKK